MGGPFADVVTEAQSATIACGASDTVYTDSFSLGDKEKFGGEIQVTTTGVVSIDVYLEQSNVKPTTENVADDNYAIPEGHTSLITVEDDEMHLFGYPPVVAKYGRFKLVSGVTNDGDNTVAMKRTFTEPGY